MSNFLKKRGQESVSPAETDIAKEIATDHRINNEAMVVPDTNETLPTTEQIASETISPNDSAPEIKNTLEETIGLILQKDGIANLFNQMNIDNKNKVIQFGKEIIHQLKNELNKEDTHEQNINDLISDWLLKFKFDPPKPGQLETAFIKQTARNHTRELLALKQP